MSLRDAAPLLSLLAHELRAPVGVLGGCLTLIERGHALHADPHQAIAGARRAQRRLMEILDDANRLVNAWTSDDATATPTPIAIAHATDDVRAASTTQGLALTVDTRVSGMMRWRGPRATLGHAIVSVAAAVAREHDAAVQVVVDRAGEHAVAWRIRPDRVISADPPAREPFDVWRPGLGLRLVVAATAIAAASGQLQEVLVNGARSGIDITFDYER